MRVSIGVRRLSAALLYRSIREEAPLVKKGAIVGINAVLIGGISVGEKSYVGANAVVTKNVKSKSKVVGIPAKPIRERSG